MTKTIKSETSNKRYFLTIDGDQATDCTCGDRTFRHHTCKHMTHFNAEVTRAAAFLALKARIAAAEREARVAHRIAFELMMGL